MPFRRSRQVKPAKSVLWPSSRPFLLTMVFHRADGPGRVVDDVAVGHHKLLIRIVTLIALKSRARMNAWASSA
jgi:hypothetical protein